MAMQAASFLQPFEVFFQFHFIPTLFFPLRFWRGEWQQNGKSPHQRERIVKLNKWIRKYTKHSAVGTRL